MALFEDILKMVKTGMSDSDIVRNLTQKGYTPVQISDAINQAKIKQSASEQPAEMAPSIMEQEIPSPTMPVPSPRAPNPLQMQMPQQQQEGYGYYPYQYPTSNEPQQPQPKMETEAIEEIAEEIVNEKWQEVKGKISDVIEWKNYAEKRIVSVEDRIKRMEGALDRLQIALLGKVQEYGQNIRDLGSEMNSMQGAFSKVLSPLVDNVKELGRITEGMKGKSKTPSK